MLFNFINYYHDYFLFDTQVMIFNSFFISAFTAVRRNNQNYVTRRRHKIPDVCSDGVSRK